jgi:hypothetical protein
MLYTSPWSRFELTTTVVIGTNSIGCCKSNYHMITTTATSPIFVIDLMVLNFSYTNLMILFKSLLNPRYQNMFPIIMFYSHFRPLFWWIHINVNGILILIECQTVLRFLWAFQFMLCSRSYCYSHNTLDYGAYSSPQ